MPSVFISYSHDPDPAHAERVTGLAASLRRDGMDVFFDQLRGGDEEKLPWPVWMEDRIEQADHVLLVCTESYYRKVRQEVPANEGRGVLWEANLIYTWLYLEKLNTSKFVPVLFSREDEEFIPKPIRAGRSAFLVDGQAGYERLCAFLTGRDRAVFPEKGETVVSIEQRVVAPTFARPGTDEAAKPAAIVAPASLPPAPPSRLALRPDAPPEPRRDIRGLDWYDECDSGHFLGREEAVARLLALLVSNPVVRLVGPSGVGKSSVVRAGLLPKIRECGWRACVVRPFDDPAARLVPQLTTDLLVPPGAFTSPLDPCAFRAEIAPLLAAANVARLVLVLDQFEDIVSPLAAPEAVDAMRDFLRDVWERRDARPYLRVVVAYRTDADARLGRLWQEVSGRPEGLPYFPLTGLDQRVTERIVEETAHRQGWRLEASVPEIIRQLAHESAKLDSASDVFPVYLQIFLKQAQLVPDGRVTSEFLAGLGGVSGLIGKYLEQTLARLKSRGGDWERCGAVLETLSRSTGAKAVQSLDDLVRESGVSRAALAEMLPVLVNERLVRPVGDETYEIQHDRLAAALITGLAESDREAKQARDLLAAKALTFGRTRAPIASEDLRLLYLHRRRIHPTELELAVLLASLCIHGRPTRHSSRKWGSLGGWYWFRNSSLHDWLRRLVQVERWTCEFDSESVTSGYSTELLNESVPPFDGLERELVVLTSDSNSSVRLLAADLLCRIESSILISVAEYLIKNEDAKVRCIIVRGLARSDNAQVVRLLREFTRDRDESVCVEAIRSIARVDPGDGLAVIRGLFMDQRRSVRCEVTKAILTIDPVEGIRRWDESAMAWSDRVDLVRALARVDRAISLPRLRDLADDEHPDVCVAAARALASLEPKAAPALWTRLATHSHARVRLEAADALMTFPVSGFPRLWRQLAKDADAYVRIRAACALATIEPSESLRLMEDLIGDDDWQVRMQSARVLVHIQRPEAEVLWSRLAADSNWEVRVETARAAASAMSELATVLWRDLLGEHDVELRGRARRALYSVAHVNAVPIWRRLLSGYYDPLVEMEASLALIDLCPTESEDLCRRLLRWFPYDPAVCFAAVDGLARTDLQGALSVIRDLALSRDSGVAEAAVRLLASLSSYDELGVLVDQHEQRLSDGASLAIDELLYMPGWMRVGKSSGDSGTPQ